MQKIQNQTLGEREHYTTNECKPHIIQCKSESDGKFCGCVHSDIFLVSTYQLLNLSSDRNHFLLSKANQAKKVPANHCTLAFRWKCQQSTTVQVYYCSGQFRPNIEMT